ncbi:tyrosine-protein phosphatase [Thermoflavimicrobium dichotomicum]|uniref:Protein-tyrosine phosphatase n=1 Tax=Thermoflavimicrobium dichotomicum TaxID=46223 RepID=A0A1I3NZM2_9BACL|nr:tyrosine-protein phosphatase [Thermoflavimicrobium dichotomicum]SFJ14743.1 protein-tyrosine phosphatase [Thermoflavimicrobium dichotomicum]
MNTVERDVAKQFDGLSNFRDIGGLMTHDGRTMKSGVLFRSDELSRLTSNDLEKLKQFNIKVICDLRTPKECKSKPARIPHNEGIRIVNVPIHHHETQEVSRLKLFGFLFGKSGGDDFDHFNREYYRRMAFECTAPINEIITLISEEKNLPALIHCNAGRDRTGYISALIQLLVGVPYETVLDDYLLTNRFYEQRLNKFIRYMRWMTLFQVSPDRMKHILQARREFLDEVIDEILKKYGSIEGYLIEACGIDQSCIRNLQQLLLEP